MCGCCDNVRTLGYLLFLVFPPTILHDTPLLIYNIRIPSSSTDTPVWNPDLSLTLTRYHCWKQERNWTEYWRLLFSKVTVNDIKTFEKTYKGSDEEIENLRSAYVDYEGDMDKIQEGVWFHKNTWRVFMFCCELFNGRTVTGFNTSSM